MVHTIQNKTAKKKSLKKASTSNEADTKNIACHRPVCTHIINLTQQLCRRHREQRGRLHLLQKTKKASRMPNVCLIFGSSGKWSDKVYMA